MCVRSSALFVYLFLVSNALTNVQSSRRSNCKASLHSEMSRPQHTQNHFINRDNKTVCYLFYLSTTFSRCIVCGCATLQTLYFPHTHKHSGKFFDSMSLCVKSYCLLHTFDWHDCDPSCHLLVDFSINFHIVIHSRGTCIEWLIRKWWEVLEFSFIKNWKLHQACKMAVRQRANANLFYMEWKLLSFYSR